jgi:hypothetical protein
MLSEMPSRATRWTSGSRKPWGFVPWVVLTLRPRSFKDDRELDRSERWISISEQFHSNDVRLAQFDKRIVIESNFSESGTVEFSLKEKQILGVGRSETVFDFVTAENSKK